MKNEETTATEEPGTRPTGRPDEFARRAQQAGRDVLDSTQRAAKSGLKAVKARARRRDRVGEATYRALELVSDGLEASSKALGQLSEAVQPPSRGGAGARAIAKGAGKSS